MSQETRKVYFVKSYKVDVSSNGEDWITLKEGSKQKVTGSNLSSPQSELGDVSLQLYSAIL